MMRDLRGKIERLYSQGFVTSEIAKKLDIPEAEVVMVLEDAGVTTWNA